ncbi:aminodeoxychorismate synthase component I [Patescibacteria group bacterium]
MPKIESVQFEEIKITKSPEELYANFADIPYTSLLCGKGGKDNGRYAFIGLNPFYKAKFTNDPFAEFQQVLDHYSVKEFSYPVNLWGGIGYFSYDAGHYVEKLPRTTKNDLKMSDMEIVFYKDMIIYDLHEDKKFLVQIKVEDDDFTDSREIFRKFNEPASKYEFNVEGPINCCSKDVYMKKVNEIMDYIVKGDVYEVSLSHRCEVPFKGHPYAVFKRLYELNPAPFSAYLPFGDHVIISSSPERFLYADKDFVESRPIKGTAPRGKTPEEDIQIRDELARSTKDDAELAMIVDLLRNDLGKVSEYGSVKVREHKRVEEYPNVWHLVSIIEGKLRLKENYGSLLRACFPGGSITGCPKIRSMEIIDELENYTRGIYTGTIFIANDQRFDSSIVIRTAIVHKDNLYFNIGGAVVYDSDPAMEYEETLHKAQSIMNALGTQF